MILLDLTKHRQEARDIVSKLYLDEEGNPIILTDGQCDVFNLIFKKLTPRVHLEAFTRYGKSLVVALAVLTRVATFPEKWAIVAGNKDKSAIIMSYIIQHIFDNKFTSRRFVVDKGETEEAIRRYRNKSRINFKLEEELLGEVFITTAESALGFGAPNIVEDEAALIPTNEHALVMRMLGDQTNNFLLKVGNPWENEHFRNSFEDPEYYQLIIDCYQGLREGRIDQKRIDEMKKQPFFEVLYECKFPPRDSADEKLWVPLLTKDDIDRAMIKESRGFGLNKLGCDIAGGGRNFSVIVKRSTNLAQILYRENEADTMKVAEAIINTRAIEKTFPNDISTDMVGLGRGVYDILRRELIGVRGVNAGDSLENEMDAARFTNLRSKMFWLMREWILGGGKLLFNEHWYELTKIKYRTRLEGTRRGKMEIMSKEEMMKNGILSPDVADALSLTFASLDIIRTETDETEYGKEKIERIYDKYGLFPDVG